MKNKLTVTLPTAKRMAELGWEKETLFYYRILHHAPNGYRIVLGEPVANEDCKFSAPIASEILMELSSILTIDFIFHKDGDFINIIAYTKYDSHDDEIFKAPTPAEALGLCWICLKEKGLI